MLGARFCLHPLPLWRDCSAVSSPLLQSSQAALEPKGGQRPVVVSLPARCNMGSTRRNGKQQLPSGNLPCNTASWDTACEKLRVATLHGRLPTSPGSLAHNRLSHTRPVRYETFLSNLRILRKTSNAALAALRHSHPFLTLAKRIGLEPKHIP